MTREQQLLELGFDKNDDQQNFAKQAFDVGHYYVDYWEVEQYNDIVWLNTIDRLKEYIKKDDLKRTIRRGLLSYGIAPLLIILAEKELEEDFEMCQSIIDVIASMNIALETRWSENTLKNLKEDLNSMGYSGDIALSNMWFYVEKLKEMIDGN